MSQREVAATIIRWMLEHDIVPVLFRCQPAAEGWTIEGRLMGRNGTLHGFHGTASPDGSSFMVRSGAFGQLTETGLDLFAGLEGAGVTTEED